MSSRRIFNHSRFCKPSFDWRGILSILILGLINCVSQIRLLFRVFLSNEKSEYKLYDWGLIEASSILSFTIAWSVYSTIMWIGGTRFNIPNQAVWEQGHYLSQDILTDGGFSGFAPIY